MDVKGKTEKTPTVLLKQYMFEIQKMGKNNGENKNRDF